MNKIKMLVILLSACGFIKVTCAAQGYAQNRHTLMRSTTQKVVEALAACDTTTLLNMLDTTYNHLGKPGARKYFASDALQKCQQYKKITAFFTVPTLDSLQLATDKTTHNTRLVLRLTGLANGALNISTCALVVSFYPAKLFSMQAPGQCLGFYFEVTPLRKTIQRDNPLQLQR